MCQYCDIDEKELIEVSPDEGFCEYATEEVPSLCGQPANYCSKFRYLDEHLCEEHMHEQANDLKGGLMDFQKDLGLSEGVVIKKIAPGETCDHASLPDLLECGRPAGYALINTALSYLCERHKDKS